MLSRSGFDRRLRGALASARSKSMQHMLFYIDLDNFKPINDTAGHEAGDAALVEIAALLQQQARKRDSLARLGGDEFALIMEQSPVEQAQRVAEAMRTARKDYRFHRDGVVFSLSVSIGLVQITAASPDVEHLLHLADEACYAAKAAGKNQVVLK